MAPWSHAGRAADPIVSAPVGRQALRRRRRLVHARSWRRSSEAGVVGEDLDHGDLEAEAALDHPDLVLLVPEHERDRDAALARPGRCGPTGGGRPSRPPAGRSARRRRRRRRGCPRAATSVATSTCTLPAGEVGSARSRAPWRRSPWMAPARTPSRRSCVDEPVGAALGAHEHQGAVGAPAIDAATFTLSIWWTARKTWSISSTVGSASSTSCEHGVVHVAVDQALDRAVERRREQHRLVLGRDAVEDLLDLGHEAHVGHAVGLVDDEHLDVARRTSSPRSMRSMSRPGRADDDVDALLQRGDLRVHGHAAVDGPDLALAHLAERAGARP